jgi:hypothetical protein
MEIKLAAQYGSGADRNLTHQMVEAFRSDARKRCLLQVVLHSTSRNRGLGNLEACCKGNTVVTQGLAAGLK